MPHFRTPQNYERIQRRIGGDPAIIPFIKALESLAKMTDREQELARNEPELTLDESLAGLICCLPMSGLGAAMAMGTFFDKAHNIINFPFLSECAPVVSQNCPEQWQRWRNA